MTLFQLLSPGGPLRKAILICGAMSASQLRARPASFSRSHWPRAETPRLESRHDRCSLTICRGGRNSGTGNRESEVNGRRGDDTLNLQ